MTIDPETVELATIAWYEATPGVSWAEAGKFERAAMLTRTKIILEAALPHLGAQEAPVCAGHCYSMTESGAGYIDPDCPKHAAPHPRPVVDREALIQTLHNAGAYCGECNFEDWDLCEDCLKILGDYADAVLALLPTETQPAERSSSTS